MIGGLPTSTDVFVIGGGPAGLAAAIAARRRGFSVTVADHSHPPIDKSCGEGVMPDGVAAATALGIDLHEADPYPFRGICFSSGGISAQADFPEGIGLGLRRTALHRLMVERASDAGVQLAWDTPVRGIDEQGIWSNHGQVRARWIVGADGGNSLVRRWAGLDAGGSAARRYGFRRHYRVAPWSEFMEVHWSQAGQLYITPVSRSEVCVVAIGRDTHWRLEDALPNFPEVARRLQGAEATTVERGGLSASRHLPAVFRGNVALVGDASGSVDAITGEGLCLLFQHATALAGALEQGDLRVYQEEHRKVGRRPEFMAEMMLLLDRRSGLRERVVRAFAYEPGLFTRLLAMHVGQISLVSLAAITARLGWLVLTV